LYFYRKGRREVSVKTLRDLCGLCELCGEFVFETAPVIADVDIEFFNNAFQHSMSVNSLKGNLS
jgi:hypothetical protein